MTVAELIEALAECDPSAVCMVSDYHIGTDTWSNREVSDALESDDGFVAIT